MALKIRFRFDVKCSMHSRYNPERDGRPKDKDCAGCESLYLINLYLRIARKRAESRDGIVVGRAGVQDERHDGPIGVNESAREPEQREAELHDRDSST